MSRSTTIARKQLKHLQVEPLTPEELAQLTRWRPRTRAQCERAERPCPHLSCKYHLAMDLKDTGSLHLPFGPDVDLDALPDTCALDAADRGGLSLEEIGQRLNITREAVRHIESAALSKLLEALSR